MLCGEYLATIDLPCIAFPTKLGQTLQVEFTAQKALEIEWTALDKYGQKWLHFKIDGKELQNHGDAKTQTDKGLLLQSILNYINQKSTCFEKTGFYQFSTQLEFDQIWGLGSSSTLVSLLSQWSKIDAFELQAFFFGGSAYDIACANSFGPIYYQKNPRRIEQIYWDLQWSKNWRILFTENKINSRTATQSVSQRLKGIAESTQKKEEWLFFLNDYSRNESCADWEKYLNEFANRLALQLDLADCLDFFQEKMRLIPSFAKYSGAWGGDMVIYSSANTTDAGIPFNDLILLKTN